MKLRRYSFKTVLKLYCFSFIFLRTVRELTFFGPSCMPGCSMIVYNVRLGKAVVAVSSRLQPHRHPQYQASGLMLTSGVELMIYVERHRVIIWRLAAASKSPPFRKYTNDDAEAEDHDCDVDNCLYDDDTADYASQVNSTLYEVTVTNIKPCRHIGDMLRVNN